jgi:exonuclease SbcC
VIPVSLRLRNFMCYREGLPPLEFGELHVACLSGPNGAGKSAILDAITWALWGRARSRSDDALIAMGALEMEVEFEFLLEGNHYRAFRRRERAGPKGLGKTQLDLQVYGALGWRSLAGESIRQTEARIVDLLRMDYDTFINSAFLLQGRADEFTVKPPAERKRILAEILGLSFYDELEQRARERLRAEERNVQALAMVLQDQERQLARREEQEQALARAQEEAARLEREAALWQEELAGLQRRVADLEATARQSEELRQHLAQAAEETQRLEESISQQEDRVAATRALVERAAEIEAGHARLQQLRERQEALSQAASRLLALSEQQRALEQAIERARSGLVTDRGVLQHSLGEIETRLKERPAIEERLGEIRQDLAVLREKESQRNALVQEAQEHAAAGRTLKAECQRLREEMEQLRKKVDMLGEETDRCPLCRSPLSDEAREHIRSSYQAEGEQKRDLYRQHEVETHRLEERLSQLQAQQDKLEQELKRIRTLENQQASLEKEQLELARLGEEQLLKQQRLQEVEGILAEGAYAAEDRAKLLALQQEMAALHYDRQEHQTLQQELVQWKAFEEEYRRLQSARERLDEESHRLEEARATWQRRQEETAADQERLRTLESSLGELSALRERREQAEASLRTAQDTLGQARQALGAAQYELERIREIEQAHEEKKHSHQQALERQGIYEELVTALGKRGVQAMLIETAVPEIEREANELLDRMTDGEMAVQLAMQRETKKGSIAETLDINISDLQGTREYSLYSGGEAFRINFALRIALSRLLARRAGASLQTLVIDEGFGTQDTMGRERVVEAIQSIQEEFEKILVITHIQELKEQFPARIEIERTPEGSRWTII